MYYEVYLDSLFLICFCMNRYLLGLASLCLPCAAAHARLWAAAAVGALGELSALLMPVGGIPLKMALLLISLYGMEGIAFRCWWGRGLVKITESLCVFFFLLGGALKLFFGLWPGREGLLAHGSAVLLAGAGCYEVIRLLVLRRKREEENCRVFLPGEGGRSMRIEGLVDTGNSLTEPISGRPVAVLEQRVWEQLYPGEPPFGMRVIPYHSVGKPAGMLMGYPVKDMEVEIGGIRQKCGDIYIAIWQERLSETGTYQILLQPAILKNEAGVRQSSTVSKRRRDVARRREETEL